MIIAASRSRWRDERPVGRLNGVGVGERIILRRANAVTERSPTRRSSENAFHALALALIVIDPA